MFEPNPSSDRTREKDLIIPALLVLAQAKRLGTGAVVVSDLERDIGTALPLTPKDLEVTASDTVTRYQRTARNLISHQVLTGSGWVRAVKGPDPARSYLKITPRGMSHLFDQMVGMFDGLVPDLETLAKGEPAPQPSSTATRRGERSLKDVALLVLGVLQKKNNGEPVNTTLLRRAIKGLSSIELSQADLEVLPGRSDTRFDQVMRNLLGSNQTLTKDRLARRSEGGFRLTPQGKAHVVMNNLLVLVPPPPSVRRTLAEQAVEDVTPTAPRAPRPRR